MTQTYDKSLYTNRNIQKAEWQHKHLPKTSITQRLCIDWGRPVWVTTGCVIQLVWLTSLQDPHLPTRRKRKRSDSVLWQKPLHQQKCQKGKVTTQTTPQKSSITQRLRTDLGRSVGVTTATQLVWLTGLRAYLPTNRNNRLIKRTHV